jgi:hypothetical protein
MDITPTVPALQYIARMASAAPPCTAAMDSAASVVAMFSVFFRNASRAELVERLRSCFSAVAEVAVAVAADDQADRAVGGWGWRQGHSHWST